MSIPNTLDRPVSSNIGSPLLFSRAIALFIACFSMLNLVGEWWIPRFDATLWWIDLRPFPSLLGRSLLLLSSLYFVAFCIRPAMSKWRRIPTILLTAALFAAAIYNCIIFYRLVAFGRIHTAMPLPSSALVAVSLLYIAITAKSSAQPPPMNLRDFLAFSTILLLYASTFSLAQIFCFGKTDYRRTADVIVVFGARAYADGRPSDALVDRVRTASQLYHAGLAPKILMSGGPGDGPIHETESMRRLAISLGVSNDDILLDPQGLNTAATVTNSIAIFEAIHARKALAVSHFYHLPRIKMTYQRSGREIYTVPASETYLLRSMPFLIVREIPAIWKYYFDPLIRLS